MKLKMAPHRNHHNGHTLYMHQELLRVYLNLDGNNCYGINIRDFSFDFLITWGATAN